jgi:glyoxylase-like metal-dependent hydrolase (beta-lactamase superfamily II)
MTGRSGRTRPTPHQDWTEPGAFAVAPGVHRIPLPLPNDALRAVNVYAVEHGDTLVLIDAGDALAEARTRLQGALRSLGRELGDVTRFVVTHIHRDRWSCCSADGTLVHRRQVVPATLTGNRRPVGRADRLERVRGVVPAGDADDDRHEHLPRPPVRFLILTWPAIDHFDA